MIKLKFGYMPAHWGLKGKSRDVAQAEYELAGYELETRLLEINIADYPAETVARKQLDLNKQYKKITETEYNRCLVELIQDPQQKALAALELDSREGKISDMEYSKQTATLRNEPWVTVISMDFSGKNSLEGSFELDWNEPFVDKLNAEGYDGITPDVAVNMWFMEVCRNVAMEEFDGTGNFTADSEANLDAVKRWGSESSVTGRRTHK